MRIYIPNHIIFGEILPLVPSRKLNEWKVACKSWYYHLHVNPSLFIKDQLAKATHSHILNMWGREVDSMLLNIEFKLDSITNAIDCISRISNLAEICKSIGLPRNETVIVGSYNGLVLINRSTYPEFHLINPSTRQWVTLPLPYEQNRFSRIRFGYDESSDKYKVLLFILLYNFECKLLTLGSKHWKSVILPCKLRRLSRQTIIMDGYMNLLCNVETDGAYDYLLAFDMSKETFELLKLPTMAFYILNIRNSLAVVPSVESSYLYYILDERKSGTWTKEYSISAMSSGHFIHPNPNRYFPLTTCNNGNTFIFQDLFTSRLFYFDPETSGYEQIELFWDRSRYHIVTSIIFDYVDTLLSPYTVTCTERKFIEDPDFVIPLRRSLRLQKKAMLNYTAEEAERGQSFSKKAKVLHGAVGNFRS